MEECRMDGWMDGNTGGWTDGWMRDGCGMDGWSDGLSLDGLCFKLFIYTMFSTTLLLYGTLLFRW